MPLRYQVLTPGDVLELDGLRFTFQQGQRQPEPNDSAASLLARAGDSEAAINVVIDMLLEQGNPLGPRLVAGERVPLAPVLLSAVDSGELELDWRRGFVRSARLRPQTSFHSLRDLLFALLSSDAARFLDTLTLPSAPPGYRPTTVTPGDARLACTATDRCNRQARPPFGRA